MILLAIDFAYGEEVLPYPLVLSFSGSAGVGAEGPAFGGKLGIHRNRLVAGVLGMGAMEMGLDNKYPNESHAKGALFGGYSEANGNTYGQAVIGPSFNYFKRRGAHLGIDAACERESRLFCADSYETEEEYPFGVAWELSGGLHAGFLGIGLSLGGDFNLYAPDVHLSLDLWLGYARYPSQGPAPQPARGDVLLAGFYESVGGKGIWLEKRHDFDGWYLALTFAGDRRKWKDAERYAEARIWSATPCLQAGKSWSWGRNEASLSTGAGVMFGRGDVTRRRLLDLNLPVETAWLYHFPWLSAGLYGGVNLNQAAAGIFYGALLGV